MAEPPRELLYLLSWYYELSSRRAITMAGAQAITFTEIDAWARRMHIEPLPSEISIICRLDDIFRVSMAERTRDETKKRSAASKSPKGRGADW